MNLWRPKPPRILILVFGAAALFGLVGGVVTAPAQQVTTLIQFTNVWKYDQSGRELGTAWRTNDYDDSAWPSGRGLLGNDPTQPFPYFPYPVGTPLTISSTTTTYYFRASFQFAGDTVGLSLVASNLVDGGCVIYLNGMEAGRIRVQMGQNATTTPPGPTSEGAIETLSITNLALLRQGENLIAVEVHRASSFTVLSTDLMWGMKLMAIRQTPLTITHQPQSQTVSVGDAVTLTVSVSGGPATYRWLKDGVLQPSTSNSLHIADAQLANTSGYRVVVSNSISSVTSSVAMLTVVADATGPRLLAAIGNNTPLDGRSAFGSNTINVLFDERLNNVATAAGVGNTNNYTVTRIGTVQTVPVLSVLYSQRLGALLNLDQADPDWFPGSDYLLTVNNIEDPHGNVIAPDSQIAVAWGQTASLITTDALWDFHASAIFEPEVFDEDWFASDFVPSFWWAQGQGIFYGGVLASNPCLPLGTFRTMTGFQPEPEFYRTTFHWPEHWPSSGTLKIAVAYDDALVLYLDGKEIYRNNAGAAGSPVGLVTRAAGSLSVCVTNLAIAAPNLQPGLHCLAAAVLQLNNPNDADSVFALRMDGLAYLPPTLPEPVPPVLSLTPLDANSARLSWAGGGYALESATNLSLGTASYPLGPWQQVTNMSNPYTNHLDKLQRFFRLKR